MNPGDREIIDHFLRTREKTIDLAQRVPEEFLGRRAEGEGGPLYWLFLHIAGGADWWMHNVIRDGRGDVPNYGRDKEGIVQALGASRDRLRAFFEAEDGNRMGKLFTFKDDDREQRCTGRDRVLYLTDHEIHHRGKIVLALRQWGFNDIPFLPY